MKSSITRNEYLQLVGLITLAKSHYKQLDDIEKTAQEILGEERASHTSDIISMNRDLDEGLKILKITVQD